MNPPSTALPADLFRVCSRLGYIPGGIVSMLVRAPHDEAGRYELATAAAYAEAFCTRIPRPVQGADAHELRAALLKIRESVRGSKDIVYRRAAGEVLESLAELLFPSGARGALRAPARELQGRMLAAFSDLVESWGVEAQYAKAQEELDNSRAVEAMCMPLPPEAASTTVNRQEESWQY